jgi:hypothetical protein
MFSKQHLFLQARSTTHQLQMWQHGTGQEKTARTLPPKTPFPTTQLL